MGLILDSSVLIASERRGGSIEDILYHAKEAHGEMDIGLSAVSVVEPPFSHSTIPQTMTLRSRRRKPAATSGEMCSSRRRLSISAFGCFPCNKFDGLRQHALQRSKIHCLVFRQRLIDLIRKRLGIVDSCLDLDFRPS
jgi:hypothetical protein